MCNNSLCHKCANEKNQRLVLEERIKELINGLSTDTPTQEFYAIKEDILKLLDELK